MWIWELKLKATSVLYIIILSAAKCSGKSKSKVEGGRKNKKRRRRNPYVDEFNVLSYLICVCSVETRKCRGEALHKFK